MPRISERKVRERDLNNPAFGSLVQDLKYVGPHIAQQLGNPPYGIIRLNDFLQYIRTHTKLQNKTMMQAVLGNPRANQCVGKRDVFGYRYKTRSYNFRAWQALIHYARRNLTRAERMYRRQSRIPDLLQVRPGHRAHPEQCRIPYDDDSDEDEEEQEEEDENPEDNE